MLAQWIAHCPTLNNVQVDIEFGAILHFRGPNARLDIGVPAIPHIWASHCLCGHLISRCIPLQCPHGQPISRHGQPISRHYHLIDCVDI